MGQAAREAAYQLPPSATAQKNRALAAIADELEATQRPQILAANEKDIAAGREAGLTAMLTPAAQPGAPCRHSGGMCAR